MRRLWRQKQHCNFLEITRDLQKAPILQGAFLYAPYRNCNFLLDDNPRENKQVVWGAKADASIYAKGAKNNIAIFCFFCFFPNISENLCNIF
jgi:hypothetical protein